MANESAETDQNPHPQGGQAEGGEKLIAGKFKTVEEAVTKGYGGLEKAFHETRQEVSRLADLMETRFAAQDQSYGQTGRESFGNPQDQQQNAGTQILTRFYQDPEGVFRAVKEQAKQEIYQETNRAQETEARNRAVLAEWTAKNPDISPYPDLLAFYVGQTDARLKPETRLEQAAIHVRKRVTELRGKPQGSGPEPGDHPEGPSGGGENQQQTAGNRTPEAPRQEGSPLVGYLAERAASRKPQKPGQRK